MKHLIHITFKWSLKIPQVTLFFRVISESLDDIVLKDKNEVVLGLHIGSATDQLVTWAKSCRPCELQFLQPYCGDDHTQKVVRGKWCPIQHLVYNKAQKIVILVMMVIMMMLMRREVARMRLLMFARKATNGISFPAVSSIFTRDCKFLKAGTMVCFHFGLCAQQPAYSGCSVNICFMNQ